MKIGFEDGGKMKEPCIRTSMLVFLLLVSVLGIWIWIFVAGTSKSLTIHIKTQSLGLLRAHQAYGLSEAFHFFSTSSTCHIHICHVRRTRQSVWFHLVPRLFNHIASDWEPLLEGQPLDASEPRPSSQNVSEQFYLSFAVSLCSKNLENLEMSRGKR